MDETSHGDEGNGLIKRTAAAANPVVRWTLRALPWAYMAVIWYLSSRPSDAVVRLGGHDQVIKEGLHLVEFGILYALWMLAFATRGRLKRGDVAAAMAIAIAYGFIDELHQAFVPWRSATLIDLIKDIAGVLVFAAVQRFWPGQCRRGGRSERRPEPRLG